MVHPEGGELPGLSRRVTPLCFVRGAYGEYVSTAGLVNPAGASHCGEDAAGDFFQQAQHQKMLT
ncbi:MAG: hypothetical protein KC643_33565 [Nitrospira sp.]|nr:hypothetical protein [Nitrospira sp.]